ncbi:MAG: hypothetical protein IPP69_01105 [Flavobacteriales bacterium]|nr:hypothetical protein [Flavobacteriales bacterium]
MKKLLLFTACVAFLSVSLQAQLSTIENYDQVLRLSTRPQAGDGALQFVIPIIDLSSSDSSNAGLYKGNSLFRSDFLTYKYYLSDQNVLRMGLRYTIANARTEGTAVDSTALNPISPDLGEVQTDLKRLISRDFAIAGGLEKHFSNSNIFDVYAGAEALIGLGKNKRINQEEYFNGDKFFETRTTNTRILGFGLVTGFNVFVAELPISIGLEYGLTGKWMFGGKTKVEQEVTVGSTSNSGEWYEQETDAFGDQDLNLNGDPQQYSDLSRRTFNLNTNHNVRLNIHIYFSTRNKAQITTR